ncbi:hypothetical protein OJF2_32270 [Aquisphaera giovannonii]|uniref:Uncharacterized protein n=1 Tax=Aquisphaera giovannonii TaxID=406548 RepID=A0A5B9W250_9BACT|nr:hypothetical protein OJF2_32270 [Aquisphaera giovannonii]
MNAGGRHATGRPRRDPHPQPNRRFKALAASRCTAMVGWPLRANCPRSGFCSAAMTRAVSYRASAWLMRLCLR